MGVDHERRGGTICAVRTPACRGFAHEDSSAVKTPGSSEAARYTPPVRARKTALQLLAASISKDARETPLVRVLSALPPAVRRDIQLGTGSLEQTVGELLYEDKQFASYFGLRMRAAARARFASAIETWAERAGPRETKRAWEGGPELSSAGLLGFANANGLQAELERPFGILRALSDAQSWWPVHYRATERIDSVLADSPSQTALRLTALHLQSVIGRPEQLRAREALVARGCATPILAAASERVRARLTSLKLPEPPPTAAIDTVVFSIDRDALALVLTDESFFPNQRVEVSLVHADADGAGIESSLRLDHPFVRIALERTIDAIHDESDALHAELRKVLEEPRWERFLTRLRDIAVSTEDAAPKARIAWRISMTRERGISIEALVQKEKRSGGFSRGAVFPFEQLRERAKLDVYDERVLAALSPKPFEGYRLLDRRAAALEALASHPRVFLDGIPIRVRSCVPELAVLEKDEELVLGMRIGDELLAAQDAARSIVAGPACVRVHEELGEVRVAHMEPQLHAIITTAAQHDAPIPDHAKNELLAVLSRLPEGIGLELPPSLAGARVEASNDLVLRLDPLAGAGLRARIFVRPVANASVKTPGEGAIHLVGVQNGLRIHTVRDLGSERRAAEDLALALGLDRAVHEGSFEYRLEEADDAVAVLEILAERPDLATVEWPDEASRWRVGSIGRDRFALSMHDARHYFEASTDVEVNEERVELARILVALRERRRYVKVGQRTFVRLADELRGQLEALAPFMHVERDGVHVGPEAIALIEATLGKDQIKGDRGWDELSQRLRESRSLVCEMPSGLRAELRDYQVDGVRWLLRTSGWARGACLADEMGLGKTVQALALVLARADSGPSLVVCPTSLADNWRRECARFAPGLRPILYRGAARRRTLEELGKGDLLIASYDIVARDVQKLSALELSTLVLDEAQAIKNPLARRTQAVLELSASMRVALTGTPIENRLSEVYSLFCVLVPGLFGSFAEFRERFVVPIEKRGDTERLAELRELLRPFLLRRTKAQVARELPPRVEVVRPVDLSDEERALYEAERRSALEMLENRRADPDFRFVLLGMLTRLRRLVCDPSLVFGETTVRSSKIEELLVLLEDLRREEHRALCFSQFTSLLARVRASLDERRIPYLYLDGSTPAAARASLVDRFQSGDDPLFLISLKAGGTGLNLTGADYVIHLDPWWNPAVEDQASDRAHRIGQTKPVTIVRFVAQATIEERVLEMHEQKRRLASGLLEGADTNAAIDNEALIELLREGGRARTRWRAAGT